MILLSRYLALLMMSHVAFLASAHAQTATVIPANEAAAHIGEYATVEGVVAKVFTSKGGNTFLNIGASYPNQGLPAGSRQHRQLTSRRCYPVLKENELKSLAGSRCTKESRRFG
jgi:hypothetical protein